MEKLLAQKMRCKEIENKISNELNSSKKIPKKNKIIQKRQLKSFLMETQVFFETDKKNNNIPK